MGCFFSWPRFAPLAVKKRLVTLLLKPGSIEVPLRRRWAASLLIVAALPPVALLAIGTLRIAIATRLADSMEIPQVRRALAFDSSNDRLYHRLGMVFYEASNSLPQGDPRESVEYLRRAVELNPRQAFYWSDLGAACEALGDAECSDLAFERSVELSPRTPQLQWLAANHRLRTGQTIAAMASFRQLLTLDGSYSKAVFAVCLRVLNDPEIVLEKLLPRQSDAQVKMAFVNALTDLGQVEFAFKVWSQAVANGSPIPLASARPYLERLIELGRAEEARAVWQEFLRSGTVTRPNPDDQENLIFNGDFEQVPINAGFDWRYTETPYLWLNFADPAAYHGSRSLRVEFTAKKNREYEPVGEIVPVTPDQTYLLTAFAKAEGITSDSGPRLRVVDPLCGSCLDDSSGSEVGTTPWHRVSLRFSTKAPTHFVKVSVWRPRCRTFPTEITGIFWLDAVALKPITRDAPKPVSDP